MANKAKGGRGRGGQGRGGRGKSSNDDEEQPGPVHETNPKGKGPSWEQAFGVKDQMEFIQKVLDKENPLKVDAKEYSLAIFGNGPFPTDEDENLPKNWCPKHEWGPHPAWVLLCWKDGRVPYDSGLHVEPIGAEVPQHLLWLQQYEMGTKPPQLRCSPRVSEYLKPYYIASC